MTDEGREDASRDFGRILTVGIVFNAGVGLLLIVNSFNENIPMMIIIVISGIIGNLYLFIIERRLWREMNRSS